MHCLAAWAVIDVAAQQNFATAKKSSHRHVQTSCRRNIAATRQWERRGPREQPRRLPFGHELSEFMVGILGSIGTNRHVQTFGGPTITTTTQWERGGSQEQLGRLCVGPELPTRISDDQRLHGWDSQRTIIKEFF